MSNQQPTVRYYNQPTAQPQSLPAPLPASHVFQQPRPPPDAPRIKYFHQPNAATHQQPQTQPPSQQNGAVRHYAQPPSQSQPGQTKVAEQRQEPVIRDILGWSGDENQLQLASPPPAPRQSLSTVYHHSVPQRQSQQSVLPAAATNHPYVASQWQSNSTQVQPPPAYTPSTPRTATVMTNGTWHPPAAHALQPDPQVGPYQQPSLRMQPSPQSIQSPAYYYQHPQQQNWRPVTQSPVFNHYQHNYQQYQPPSVVNNGPIRHSSLPPLTRGPTAPTIVSSQSPSPSPLKPIVPPSNATFVGQQFRHNAPTEVRSLTPAASQAPVSPPPTATALVHATAPLASQAARPAPPSLLSTHSASQAPTPSLSFLSAIVNGPRNVIGRVTAHSSYRGRTSDELSVEPGAELAVVKQLDSGWFIAWDAQRSKMGLVPAHCSSPLRLESNGMSIVATQSSVPSSSSSSSAPQPHPQQQPAPAPAPSHSHSLAESVPAQRSVASVLAASATEASSHAHIARDTEMTNLDTESTILLAEVVSWRTVDDSSAQSKLFRTNAATNARFRAQFRALGDRRLMLRNSSDLARLADSSGGSDDDVSRLQDLLSCVIRFSHEPHHLTQYLELFLQHLTKLAERYRRVPSLSLPGKLERFLTSTYFKHSVFLLLLLEMNNPQRVLILVHLLTVTCQLPQSNHSLVESLTETDFIPILVCLALHTYSSVSSSVMVRECCTKALAVLATSDSVLVKERLYEAEILPLSVSCFLTGQTAESISSALLLATALLDYLTAAGLSNAALPSITTIVDEFINKFGAIVRSTKDETVLSNTLQLFDMLLRHQSSPSHRLATQWPEWLPLLERVFEHNRTSLPVQHRCVRVWLALDEQLDALVSPKKREPLAKQTFARSREFMTALHIHSARSDLSEPFVVDVCRLLRKSVQPNHLLTFRDIEAVFSVCDAHPQSLPVQLAVMQFLDAEFETLQLTSLSNEHCRTMLALCFRLLKDFNDVQPLLALVVRFVVLLLTSRPSLVHACRAMDGPQIVDTAIAQSLALDIEPIALLLLNELLHQPDATVCRSRSMQANEAEVQRNGYMAVQSQHAVIANIAAADRINSNASNLAIPSISPSAVEVKVEVLEDGPIIDDANTPSEMNGRKARDKKSKRRSKTISDTSARSKESVPLLVEIRSVAPASRASDREASLVVTAREQGQGKRVPEQQGWLNADSTSESGSAPASVYPTLTDRSDLSDPSAAITIEVSNDSAVATTSSTSPEPAAVGADEHAVSAEWLGIEFTEQLSLSQREEDDIIEESELLSLTYAMESDSPLDEHPMSNGGPLVLVTDLPLPVSVRSQSVILSPSSFIGAETAATTERQEEAGSTPMMNFEQSDDVASPIATTSTSVPVPLSVTAPAFARSFSSSSTSSSLSATELISEPESFAVFRASIVAVLSAMKASSPAPFQLLYLKKLIDLYYDDEFTLPVDERARVMLESRADIRVMHSMKKFELHEGIQGLGCRLLDIISSQLDLAPTLLDHGALELIIAAMRLKENVCEQALRTFTHLLRHGDVAVSVTHTQVLPMIATVMKRWSWNADIQRLGCEIISIVATIRADRVDEVSIERLFAVVASFASQTQLDSAEEQRAMTVMPQALKALRVTYFSSLNNGKSLSLIAERVKLLGEIARRFARVSAIGKQAELCLSLAERFLESSAADPATSRAEQRPAMDVPVSEDANVAVSAAGQRQEPMVAVPESELGEPSVESDAIIISESEDEVADDALVQVVDESATPAHSSTTINESSIEQLDVPVDEPSDVESCRSQSAIIEQCENDVAHKQLSVEVREAEQAAASQEPAVASTPPVPASLHGAVQQPQSQPAILSTPPRKSWVAITETVSVPAPRSRKSSLSSIATPVATTPSTSEFSGVAIAPKAVTAAVSAKTILVVASATTVSKAVPAPVPAPAKHAEPKPRMSKRQRRKARALVES